MLRLVDKSDTLDAENAAVLAGFADVSGVDIQPAQERTSSAERWPAAFTGAWRRVQPVTFRDEDFIAAAVTRQASDG